MLTIPSKIVSRAVHASVTGVCSLIGWLMVDGPEQNPPSWAWNRDDLTLTNP